jgi:hypothetical protein
MRKISKRIDLRIFLAKKNPADSCSKTKFENQKHPPMKVALQYQALDLLCNLACIIALR